MIDQLDGKSVTGLKATNASPSAAGMRPASFRMGMC